MQPVAVSSRTDGVKRYQSTFSFTPKQSGKLDMPPFVFQGEARLDTRGKMKYDSLLDFMLLGLQSTATQPVSTQTQPFSLNIKHKPATYQGWWLPSPHTTLTESYQMPDTLGVGEPITRTLTLTAQDVAADDRPVPSIKETDTIKVYANPEQRLDTPEGGQVTVTLTLVPTQPGEISLPAAAVSWFNTTTEKIETASVPERVIFVSGTSSDIQQPSAPVISEKSSDETKATAQPIQNVPQPLPWVWIILSLSFAFVFGIIVAVLILKHSQSTERKKKKPLPDLYPF
jgi:hypothetical protein